jgi:hypothetical protein
VSLDITATLQQVEAVADLLRGQAAERRRRLEALAAYARGVSPEALRAALGALPDRLPFLPAEPLEPPASAHTPPPLPRPWRVLAVDGSHIDVSRHLPLRCYLINIGRVRLTYGGGEPPLLDSTPRLFATPEDLVLTDPSGRQAVSVEGALVHLHRSALEVDALAGLAKGCTLPCPTVALIDGSLVLWAPEGGQWPEVVRQRFVRSLFLRGLEELRQLGQRFPLAVAGYISLPNSAEVVNTLRLALCPHQGGCPALQGKGDGCPSTIAHGFVDRDLFTLLLRPGQRSGLFRSLASLVREEYGEGQGVFFFYLHVGPEIARVETPAWCAGDPRLLGLLHAGVLGQAECASGYPLALQEAHEQAVVSPADREAFRLLVEEALARRGLPVYTSEKQRSKRLRSL